MSNEKSTAEGSKPSTATPQAGPSASAAESSTKKLPQLGALEDDDEFEVSHLLLLRAVLSFWRVSQ